jgi:hypothetical protein
MRILFLASAALIATMGVPTSAQRSKETALTPKVAEVLAGRTAGKPVSCVRLRDVRSTQIVDESAIIYKLNNKRWLVNFPAGGCASLRPDRTLVTSTPSTSLCRGDIARVIDPPTPIEYGSCGLGDFVPYTR